MLRVKIMAKWKYLLVEISNKGRTISENGKVVKSHTKNDGLTTLPRNMWNAKGKKMSKAANGDFLNDYGNVGWELISISFGEEPTDNQYFFKKSIK